MTVILAEEDDGHVNRPRIDGIEALRLIKETPSTRFTPVIMPTTTVDPRESNRCYELGGNVYLTRPVQDEVFIDAIRHPGMFLQIVKRPRDGRALR